MNKTATDMKTYRKRIQEALGDDFLRSALDKFNVAYREARPLVYKDIDFEGIRDEIRDEKDALLPRLTELFEQFKKNAEAAGAVVHTAKDAAEANEIIAGIARENGVTRVIKSKSMTAEETFLNDRLLRDNLKVTETDLGEWIIQLRGEGPSHMVMPAIHLSRYQVGDLFEQVTGETLDPEEIDRLVKVARRKLRQEFLSAEMGISGANFAIADSGTLAMVSNEGNLRLVTTMPKVHVALLGYEKLVPDVSTVLKILKVLPRNATGQALTSYVTWIHGATECLASPTGKKIFHIVFLDNGRLDLSANPVFSEALRCIRCGACANVCPIYSKIGGHKYGHVYIGAIGLILTLFYHGEENARAIVRNCLNCLSCKAVCPVGIDLPHLIKKTRRKVMDIEQSSPIRNRFLSGLMKNRKLFHSVLRKAWLIQKPLIDEKKGKDTPMIRHLPHFLEKKHGFRSLPPIARKPFRDVWKTTRFRTEKPDLKIAFFAGCAIDFVYPNQAMAFMNILKKRNIAVDFPMDQTCCGLPLAMSAEEDASREVAWQNINAFSQPSESKDWDYIVTLCASCASHLSRNYKKLFDGIEIDGKVPSQKTLDRFTKKIIDFSSFMIDIVGVSPEEFRKNGPETAYHSPCHLGRSLGVTKAPRNLIKTAGLSYIPAKDEDVCCGFGGSYSIDFPEISSEILKKKIGNLEKTGAEMVVTDCPGCVLQIQGGMDKRGLSVKVRHIAEVVAEQLK